jgi:hypothetical protein
VSTGGASTPHRRSPKNANAAAARCRTARSASAAGTSGATQSTPQGSLTGAAIYPERDGRALVVAVRVGGDDAAGARRQSPFRVAALAAEPLQVGWAMHGHCPTELARPDGAGDGGTADGTRRHPEQNPLGAGGLAVEAAAGVLGNNAASAVPFCETKPPLTAPP